MGKTYADIIEEHDQQYFAEMDRLRDQHDHDPIEDIVLNDEDECLFGYYEGYCSYEAYLEMERENAVAAMMATIYQIIEDENQYGHIMEAADKYYEELDSLEDAINNSVHDPMANLLHSMKIAEQYGCHMDKHYAYEGFDVMAEESADDNFGDGDPSQWEY